MPKTMANALTISDHKPQHPWMALLAVNKRIRNEGLRIFFLYNTFLLPSFHISTRKSLLRLHLRTRSIQLQALDWLSSIRTLEFRPMVKGGEERHARESAARATLKYVSIRDRIILNTTRPLLELMAQKMVWRWTLAAIAHAPLLQAIHLDLNLLIFGLGHHHDIGRYQEIILVWVICAIMEISECNIHFRLPAKPRKSIVQIEDIEREMASMTISSDQDVDWIILAPDTSSAATAERHALHSRAWEGIQIKIEIRLDPDIWNRVAQILEHGFSGKGEKILHQQPEFRMLGRVKRQQGPVRA